MTDTRSEGLAAKTVKRSVYGMMVVSVVGARPQFIKAAPVSEALREAGHHEFLIHTGQHYDYGMSRVFFEELGIAEPDVNR